MVKKSYVASAVQFNRLSPYQKQMIYFFPAENSLRGLQMMDTNRWRLLTELTFSSAFNNTLNPFARVLVVYPCQFYLLILLFNNLYLEH